MKKRIAAAALCLLLALGTAVPTPAAAAGSVYFTAAGNEILPLDAGTMPFWSNGYLYVASSIFTGQVNRSLGVAYLPSSVSNPNLCILYGGQRSLMFDLSGNFVRDTDGNITFLGAIRRGGEIFVPASVVADFFNLDYSVTPLTVGAGGEFRSGALVWLRQPNFGLAEKEFINAALSQIGMRYEQYLREQNSAANGENTPGGAPEPGGAEEKSVYLCLEAGDNAASLLDVLDGAGAQAAFFCSRSFLESQGDLLRRMTATGQAIGLLVDAGDPEESLAEQLEAANRSLARATMGKTRLVRIQNGGERSLREAGELGFFCLTEDLNWSGSGLQSASQADALLRQVSARRGDSRVWLGAAAGASGLRAFLSAAGESETRCLALTETLP